MTEKNTWKELGSIFSDEDLSVITDLLRNKDFSGWFKNNEGGPYLREFQRKFAEFCGAKYAFAVSSGSAALYTALKACGVDGDFVAVPSYTHIGSVAPIMLAGAEPFFVDVDQYGNIDPEQLRKTAFFPYKAKVKAVIVVHQLGLPCDMDKIISYLPNHVSIIEDASHALGAEYKGKKAGVLGDVGCFSIGGGRTKTIGAGEGGVIVCNDDELAEKCKNMRNHGDRSSDVDYFCFNFRMSDLNAAVALAQMKKLEFLIDWQIRNAEYLIGGLPDYLEVPALPSHVKSVRYLIGCHFSQKKAGMPRDEFLKKVKEKGYQKGPRKFVGGGYSKLISDVKFYSRYRRELPISEKLIKESVWIDWHRWPRTKEEIDELLNCFKEMKQSI